MGVGEVLLVVPGRGDAQGLGLLHGYKKIFYWKPGNLCSNNTDVVNHCTAIVLEAGGVAHEAEGGNLAGDPDVTHLGVVLQPPGGRVEQPLSALD